MIREEYIIDYNNLEQVFEDLCESEDERYDDIRTSLYTSLEKDIRTGGADAMRIARYLEKGRVDEAEELTYDVLEE